MPGAPPATEEWLHYRLGFFWDACLPSVTRQRGAKWFDWLVLFDDRSSDDFREQVEEMAEGGVHADLVQQALNGVILPGPGGPRGDLAALLAQHPAYRLDRVAGALMVSMNPVINGCGGRVFPRRRLSLPEHGHVLAQPAVLRFQSLDLLALLGDHPLTPARVDVGLERPTAARTSRETPSCLDTATINLPLGSPECARIGRDL